MRHHTRLILLAAWVAAAAFPLPAQQPPLTVERQGDVLRVTAPQMHFLEGKPLEQLHNGASVTYEFEVTVASSPGERRIHHSRATFAVSFDLWEERFTVVQTSPVRRTGSHMTSTAAELWCMGNLAVPLQALSPENAFVIKLECRIVGNGEEGGSESRPASTALAGLIEIFSRKGNQAPPRWEAVSASLRLGDLKAKNERPAGRRVHHPT
jgi:hypothetical protein